MSSEMKVQGINVPNNSQAMLISFATAKEPTAPSFLQEAMALKIAFKDRTQQPTGQQVQDGIEILKKLRTQSAAAIDAGNSAFKLASIKDTRIPILGIWMRALASETSRKIYDATATLVKQSSNLVPLQKKFETHGSELTKMKEKCEARAATLVVKEQEPVTNEDIKAQLKPQLIWINGVQQSLQTLFTALLPGADKAKIESRVKTFGEPGMIPENLDGDDLDILADALPNRFEGMSTALSAHLNQKVFRNNDGSQFFAGQENVNARKIIIEGKSVRHETEFELSRDGVAVATVKASVAADSTSCTFDNIQVKYGLARMPDYEKLLRIFKEPAVSKVAEASVAAQ